MLIQYQDVNSSSYMVGNLAEKVARHSLNRGHCVLFAYNWDHENCPLYRVAGFSLFRGCLCIEVNGKTVRTFKIAHHIVGVCCWEVSVKRGFVVYSAVYVLLLYDAWANWRHRQYCNFQTREHSAIFVLIENYWNVEKLLNFEKSHEAKMCNYMIVQLNE